MWSQEAKGGARSSKGRRDLVSKWVPFGFRFELSFKQPSKEVFISIIFKSPSGLHLVLIMKLKSPSGMCLVLIPKFLFVDF